MGLAASQARFLGITLRKANLEFRSTELAQQKLELTDQMSMISQDYSNAINATKLTWVNEECDGNYGLTYSLLMMPSAANNYNPYMVTTRAGAVVLNSKYRAAAEAAGISMAGGIASESGYKKFVKEMGAQGLITGTTENILSSQTWHSTAGLGAMLKDKSTADNMTLSDLVASPDFGDVTIDWLQIYRAALGYDYDDMATEAGYQTAIQEYDDKITNAKLQYSKADKSDGSGNYGSSYVNDMVNNANNQVKVVSGSDRLNCSGIMAEFQTLEDKIASEANKARKWQFTSELENLKRGLDPSGNPIGGDIENTLKYPLYWSVYEKAKYEAIAGRSSNKISWASDDDALPNNNKIGFNTMFDLNDRAVNGANYTVTGTTLNNKDLPDGKMNSLTVIVNNIIESQANKIETMSIADLLTSNVSLMTYYNSQDNEEKAAKSLEVAGGAILDQLARVFGYGSIGTGLNIDATTDAALTKALDMTKNKFLKSSGKVSVGSKIDALNPMENDAYLNAQNYNRIGTVSGWTWNGIGSGLNKGSFAALNISNMLSAFLTYYDNALRGAESDYIVGKSNDNTQSSSGTRNYFVTDDPDYIYITNVENAMSNDEKLNDFYSELYNSICEHGWRYDGNLDDYEYLESTIKDGRYSLMALNSDGYYYQSKYNDIEYIVEEQDKDAIARAEADFTRKKAEITNKEDIIDIKTKKLDAEIAELTTEMNSVQNLITKSIEKTFAMFSN